MNHRHDNEEDEHAAGRRDREISLGTTTVLGLFFGLALLCAAFFGFGYSLGSKHVAASVAGEQVPARGGAKPAPGSLIGSASNPYAAPAPVASSALPPMVVPARAGAAQPGVAAPAEAFEADVPVLKPSKTPPQAFAQVAAAAAPVAVPVLAQQLVVQVAALSHQEDAELIRTTLERRGYSVAIRADAQDRLLHVQIGPFSTRKDAEAMRQRLLGDGFNAYIK